MRRAAVATSDSASRLSLALDVEAHHAGVERAAHFGARLARREDDLRRIAAHQPLGSELAARRNVEAAPGLARGLQHGQSSRIGLHRIADEMIAALQRAPRYAASARASQCADRRTAACRGDVPARRPRQSVDEQAVAAIGDVRMSGQAHRARPGAGGPARRARRRPMAATAGCSGPFSATRQRPAQGKHTQCRQRHDGAAARQLGYTVSRHRKF